MYVRIWCAFILSVVQVYIRTHRSLSCVFIPFKCPGSPSKSICFPKLSQFLDLVCIYTGVVQAELAPTKLGESHYSETVKALDSSHWIYKFLYWSFN